MNLLQEDPAEITRDALLTITKQLANQSTPPFERSPFHIPPYALRVNAYFFTSIVLSLIAALGAVLALQWVSSYDFGLDQSSPKARALQRHFRFLGIREWKMEEIIAFIPIPLFLSLFLFLIGLAEWVFQLHKFIFALIMLGISIAASFFTTTTILGIRHVNSPFQTPASRSITPFYNVITRYARRLHDRLLTRIQAPPIPDTDDSFRERERKAVKSDLSLEVSSLLWVVDSTEILPHARETFMRLLEAFVELRPKQLLSEDIGKVTWLPIFEMLCLPYQGKSSYQESERKSNEVIAQALAMIEKFEIEGDGSRNTKGFLDSLGVSDDSSDSPNTVGLYAELALWKRDYPSARPIHKIFTSFIGSLNTLPQPFAALALTTLNNQTEHMKSNKSDILKEIGTYCFVDMQDITTTPPIRSDLLDGFLETMRKCTSFPIASIGDSL
jgi:hypothetical protein